MEEKVNELTNVRKLATIARIEELKDIPDALNIEHARVRGWWVVVKRGEFLPGDLCVYAEVDSVFPDGLSPELALEWKNLQKELSRAATEDDKNEIKIKMARIGIANTIPQFEFLRGSKFRIRTKRIFGEISQGIVFPLNILGMVSPVYAGHGADNDDVTKLLGVTQYVAPDPAIMGGDAKGEMQSIGLLISDEERIENLSGKYETMKQFTFYETEKLEGCLDENTLLETEDGRKTIKEICEIKYSGKIKSFDIINNRVVYTKITDHFIKPNDNKKWFEIELESGEKLLLTENHRVWIPKLNCWRRADELTGEEELLIKYAE